MFLRRGQSPPYVPSSVREIPTGGSGYGSGMMKIERTVHTDASLDRVWSYLSDFTNTTEWDPGTVRTVLLSGDGGPGTEYHNTSKFAGRETELVYVVQESTPRERIVLRAENKTLVATDSMTMDAAGSGTDVTYLAQFDFKGVAKYLEPLLKLPIKKLGDEGERGLREALGRL